MRLKMSGNWRPFCLGLNVLLLIETETGCQLGSAAKFQPKLGASSGVPQSSKYQILQSISYSNWETNQICKRNLNLDK